ncbi:MAG: thermonuclease family protein [Deltaproteobacteria bacterium]|nr:thermonuclease family protein [Nannocystaceae bacterium]
MPSRRPSTCFAALLLPVALAMFAFVLAPLEAAAAQPRTKVFLNDTAVPVSFNDGDSFRILAGTYNGAQARLAGFNTLESHGPVHQWGSWTAKEMYVLAKLAMYHGRRGVWHCTTDGKSDTYNRVLTYCPDLAESLIRAGLAHVMSIDDKPGNPELVEAQREAQRARRGMWAHGVPPFVLTSLHSVEEDTTGEGTYNRLVSSDDGHSVKWKHDDKYAECKKICHMVYEIDAAKVDEVTKALAADAKAEQLIRGVAEPDLRQAVEEFAKWRHVSRAIAKDNRLELERVLQGYADSGALGGQRGNPGACMIHVPFERRYGGGRAACLR